MAGDRLRHVNNTCKEKEEKYSVSKSSKKAFSNSQQFSTIFICPFITACDTWQWVVLPHHQVLNWESLCVDSALHLHWLLLRLFTLTHHQHDAN